MSFLGNSKGLLPTLGLFGYEYGNAFSRYASMDCMTFCRKQGILPEFVDTVLHPFADAAMNRMEVLSAAEALRYFHFYFMGSPEGLVFRITIRDCMSALIDSLEARLRELGVKIMKGCTARKIITEGKRVTGVLPDRGSGGSSISLRVDAGDVPSNGFGLFLSREGTPVLLGRQEGSLKAYDARCTHTGCPVNHDKASGGFYCPCHSGWYDASGAPVSGPPKKPLARLGVTAESGTVVVRSPVMESQIASLGEADPCAVYRLWLDKPFDTAHFPFYTTSGFTYTDSATLSSHFQEPFISWARKHAGTVVELHAYAIAPEDIRPEEEIKTTMLKEMRSMFPESAGARVLHGLYMQEANFNRWAPGDHARRPGVETLYTNLFLAGDWVKVDAPVFLMEAAAFTGRMAANAIFRSESLKTVPLPIVPMDGIFA